VLSRHPPRTAIVVPGHGRLDDDGGGYRISDRCARLVAEAERLAPRVDACAVVFSGWAPAGSEPEAVQMRRLWEGGGAYELLVEPTARTTAENAARTLPLLRERAIERAIVVCAPLHVYRTRWFFRRLYAPAGIDVGVRVAPVAPSPAALLWELLALPLRKAQLRAAQSELGRYST
jgi:uncharacterized SAM-binding protein YcdF (DUF218 family)